MAAPPHGRIGTTVQQTPPQSLESLCRAFASSVDGRLNWSWEARFNCVVAAFKGPEAEEISKALDASFSDAWRTDTIGDASDAVQGVAKNLGLRPDQILYSADAFDGQLLGAWWPWSGGQMISIRILSTSADPDQMKRWFGIG